MSHDRQDWHVRLEAYLDGELDQVARQTFEAETAADPALQAELAARRRFRSQTREALSGDLPSDLAQLATAVGRRPRGESRFRVDRRWVAVALAATLALVIVVPGVLRNQLGVAGSHATITRSGQLVAVRFGEIQGDTIELEAGCYDLDHGECR